MKHFCFKRIIPVTRNLQLHKSYLSHDVLGMISCLNVLTPSSGSQPFFELSALPALVQSGGVCFRKVTCLFLGGLKVSLLIMCFSPSFCICTWALAFKVWAGVAKLKGVKKSYVANGWIYSENAGG